MRRAARVDSNQSEVVAALRSRGYSVQPLHTVGKGCPDLLVGINGRNVLLEIKDGSKVPSKQRLTPDERRWHEQWAGQVAIACDVEEALAILERCPCVEEKEYARDRLVPASPQR